MNQNISQTIKDLHDLISNCVFRHDNVQYSIFKGCYDWHSCVHGHWALFRIARVLPSDIEIQLTAKKVMEMYQDELVEGELKFLKNNPTFEIPYGYAWFLRLVVDFEKWIQTTKLQSEIVPPNRFPLSKLAEYIFQKLLDFVTKSSVNPSTREYQNTSWALVQIHDYAIHKQDSDTQKKIHTIVSESFSKYNNDLEFNYDHSSGDFFSPLGNWIYCTAKICPELLDLHFLRNIFRRENISKISEFKTDHHIGALWNRVWCFRCVKKKFSLDDLEETINDHIEWGFNHNNSIKQKRKK